MLTNQLITKMRDSQALLTKMNSFLSPPVVVKMSVSPSDILRRNFLMGATDVKMQYDLNNKLPGQSLHNW